MKIIVFLIKCCLFIAYVIYFVSYKCLESKLFDFKKGFYALLISAADCLNFWARAQFDLTGLWKHKWVARYVQRLQTVDISSILISILSFIHCEFLHVQNWTFSPLHVAGLSSISSNGPTGQSSLLDLLTERQEGHLLPFAPPGVVSHRGLGASGCYALKLWRNLVATPV